MTTTTRTQLAKLAQRIPTTGGPQGTGFIEKVKSPGGPQDYVAHHVINQFLLYIVGPFSFELVQVHRGDVLDRGDEGKFKGWFTDSSPLLLRNVVVGATFRLRTTVDGTPVVIEATGDVDQPTNWQHDGARLKDAESDALKRAAMRLGLGLELWAKEHYVLDRWLPLPAKDSQLQASGAETPTRAVAEGAGPGSATPAPDDNPPRQRATRTRSTSSKARQQEDASAPAAGPEPPPAGDAPATPAPIPPGGAAGATNGQAHPADEASNMEQLASALGRSMTNCWLRLRRAAQNAELPAQPFGSLGDAGALKALAGDDFRLAKAWLIDHNRQTAA